MKRCLILVLVPMLFVACTPRNDSSLAKQPPVSAKKKREPKPKPSPSKLFKSLEVTSAVLKDGNVQVDGKTDLPDGSKLNVSFNIQQNDDDTYIGVDEKVSVLNQHYEAKLPFPSRPEFKKGPYVVEVMFTPRGQSNKVISIVGKDGERISGDLARKSSSGFSVLENSKLLTSLNAPPPKTDEFHIPSLDLYASDTPEYAFIRVLKDWQQRDWQALTEQTHPSWKSTKSDPLPLVKARTELVTVFGATDITTEPGGLPNMTLVNAKLDGAIGSNTKRWKLQINMVKEDGRWGWNPNSLKLEEL